MKPNDSVPSTSELLILVAKGYNVTWNTTSQFAKEKYSQNVLPWGLLDFLMQDGWIPKKLQESNSRITKIRRPLNPSQTYIATALRPLRDWQFSPIAEVATRSPIGPGEVAEKSATDRGPRCDQISRSQVFVLAQKPGCDWFGRRQVPAKSPTSPRSVAD